MKNLIIISVIILSVFSNVFAQDFRLTGVSATLGKGSVFSGYDIRMDFSNDNGNNFSVTGNHTRMHLGYSWDLSPLTICASGGFNKNAPWVGPKIMAKIGSHISTLHWLAISAGVPEKPAFEAELMFSLNAIYVSIWKLQFSYSLLHWLDERPQHLPGAFFGEKLGDGWSYSVGAEYNLTKPEPLFQFVIKKSF